MKSQYNFAFNSSFEYHSGGKMAKNLSKVFSNEQNARHEHRKQEVYLRTAGRRESCDRHILRSRNRIG